MDVADLLSWVRKTRAYSVLGSVADRWRMATDKDSVRFSNSCANALFS